MKINEKYGLLIKFLEICENIKLLLDMRLLQKISLYAILKHLIFHHGDHWQHFHRLKTRQNKEYANKNLRKFSLHRYLRFSFFALRLYAL